MLGVFHFLSLGVGVHGLVRMWTRIGHFLLFWWANLYEIEWQILYAVYRARAKVDRSHIPQGCAGWAITFDNFREFGSRLQTTTGTVILKLFLKCPAFLHLKKDKKQHILLRKGCSNYSLSNQPKKLLARTFFGDQWNGFSSLILTDIVNIESFFEISCLFCFKKYQIVLILTKKYHFLNNFRTPVWSPY